MPKLTESMTKQTMLSNISRVFDALGWFSPTTIQIKIIILRTSELDIGWDDQVPEHIPEKWKSWRSGLPVLSNKHLQQYLYLKDEKIQIVQIHGFCKASEEAYGAVTYLKSTYTSGKVHIVFIIVKTKVAPMKRQSIPRLELCGALILSRIIK